MKKLNSGSSAASAMKRLEESYTAVLKALETHQASGGTVNVVAVSPKTTPVPEVNIKAEEELPVSAPVVEPPVMSPAPEPKPIPEPPIETAPPAPPAALVEEPPRPVPVNTPPVKKEESPQVAPIASSWSHEESVPTPPPAPAQASGFASLADLKKPHTLEDLQANAAAKTAPVSGDPLFSKEVDDGLEQLLAEWSIFKKSGLFGTGPKGHEHPLFKKMAPLHIPLLLAGRFEGATQEIKQSVTDYMNGWRYEQGIIYQQGETFEHYLRRVIRHILDLQKG
jgi:hypothetical protein